MNTKPWEIPVTKSCIACGELFQSLTWHNKVYCSVKCRRRTKHSREMERGRPAFVQANSQFFAEVKDPNLIQINEMAKLILLEMTNDKPIRFQGSVPMWEPPKGVLFVKQQGIEPEEWVMFHPSMVE